MPKKEKGITLEAKKLASMGPDVVLIIPRKLVKHNVIDPNKRYDITLREHKKKRD